MAAEILMVPEEHLAEVIEVIREGLLWVDVAPVVRDWLQEWCSAEEAHLQHVARAEEELC